MPDSDAKDPVVTASPPQRQDIEGPNEPYASKRLTSRAFESQSPLSRGRDHGKKEPVTFTKKPGEPHRKKEPLTEASEQSSDLSLLSDETPESEASAEDRLQ